MSKWTYIAVLGAVILLIGSMARFTGKANGVVDLAVQATEMDEAECVDKYSIPAPTPFGATAARGMCSELANFFTEPDRKRAIECILPRILEARTEEGVRIAAVACYQRLGLSP